MLEQPLPFYLARADAARGERAFARCAACHTIEEGGTGSVGPNLWGVSGNRLAASSSYAYSDALRNRGGNWDWAMLNAWLTLPRAFAPGTRMTFAGVSGAQERADLLLFLNEHGGTLSLPDPAEGAAR